jgi:hypothetical protein
LNLCGDLSNWDGLLLPLPKLLESMNKSLLLNISEMFVNNGDICAMLFTNTVAMHTDSLREIAEMPSAQNNTKIVLERRIQNVLKDKDRNAKFEMFVGMNWENYFPSQNQDKTRKFRFVTNYPAFVFYSLQSLIDYHSSEENCLLDSNTKLSWVMPRDFDFVEMNIFLPFYCRVTELALTVRHGIDEKSFPSRMDVYVGTHIDDCTIGFQNLIIPRCGDGIKLLYTLPTQISGINKKSTLYDYNGKTASSNMRVVRIVFNGLPQGGYMTLGRVR